MEVLRAEAAAVAASDTSAKQLGDELQASIANARHEAANSAGSSWQRSDMHASGRRLDPLRNMIMADSDASTHRSHASSRSSRSSRSGRKKRKSKSRRGRGCDDEAEMTEDEVRYWPYSAMICLCRFLRVDNARTLKHIALGCRC